MKTLRRLLLLSALLPLLAAGQEASRCLRIVSQSPYISRALEWLGLGECIVGVSRYDSLIERRNLPDTGGVLDPDADVIGLLAPQLLIAADWTDAAKWRAMAPAGAVALRVDGFHGMADAERMLRDIGRAAGVADIDRRVDGFAAEWRAAAGRVPGDGRRALVMTACGGAPYSFGRGTTLHDLFNWAGFRLVAGHDGIRNFLPDGPADELPRWLDEVRPEIVFVLKNRRDEACNAALARPGTRIVPLDAEGFNHPGPALLDGLEQLRRALAP